MEYRPSVKPFRFGLLSLGVISGFLSIMTTLIHAWVIFALIVIGWVALLAYIGVARVVVTHENIEYKGLLNHWSLKIEEITKMVRLQDQGWPKDRIYGRETWEISTSEKKVRVNLLMFVKARMEIQELMQREKKSPSE